MNTMLDLADESLAHVSGGTASPAKPITEETLNKAIHKALDEFVKKFGFGRTRCFPTFPAKSSAARPAAHRV
ncbi:hypothetical protein LZC95_51040 [Pendulispora brunnea]|uniref:Uncharacterized protein n=1 Tax=Pendulispora brunnea TaxID=2905690 RepID=A0ABZ2KCD6_9BACT